MGRSKQHDSANERYNAHRNSKIRKSINRAFCTVCNDYIECNGEVEIALNRHRRSSKRHKDIVNANLLNTSAGDTFLDEDTLLEESVDDNEIVMEIGPVLIDQCDDVYNFPSSPLPLESTNRQVLFRAGGTEMDMGSEDVFDEVVIDTSDNSDMEDHVFAMQAIPDESEYLLLNTSLPYGKKTVYDLLESPILNIQEELLKGFNNIVQGKSPYEFSKVKGREVDWITCLEITTDFIDSNESNLLGDRRLNTTRRALKRETKKSARLPKRISTLIDGFCKYLDDNSFIHQWTGDFFNEFLTLAKKQAMRAKGIRWRPMTGHFIPLESAIAQMLLRLDPDEFDSIIGPCYQKRTNAAGEEEKIRVYNAFNSSKYAMDLQRKINTLCFMDKCKPLLLSIAVWVDKSALNKSMTRKATPVMLYLMNDKTRKPFRIGYAPDEFVNNEECLESILRNENVSQATSVNQELIREHKRQALIDYINNIFEDFLKGVVLNLGMDVQVGIGPKANYFRVFPVLTHFITDNKQAVELCSVNIDHCRMGNLLPGTDFSHYQIGEEKTCFTRDMATQKEVCADFSKYETIRIKNIADGHNASSLEDSVRKNIKDSKEQKEKLGGLSCNNHLYGLSELFQDVPDVITIARLFPSDFLHGLNQGIVQYVLSWTLEMVYILRILDTSCKDLPRELTAFIQKFPAHNSFHPIKHFRFEDVTSLMKQEKKILKVSDYNFDNTGILALTETWKLMTALFQLLFVITNGKVFPSDLNWGKKHDITEKTFNMERCFINAIVGCIEIHLYAGAQNLTERQVETYRKVISNAQSHIIILHHVRVLVMNRLSMTTFLNAQIAAEKRKKKEEENCVDDTQDTDSDDNVTQRSKKKKQVGTKSNHSKEGTQSSRGTKVSEASLSTSGSSYKKLSGKKKEKNLKFKPSSILVCAKKGKRFNGTYKFHLLTHLPDQVIDFGSIKENVDTSIMESTNIDMTDSFDRTTKRFDSTTKELLQISQRNFHIASTVIVSKSFMLFEEDAKTIVTLISQDHPTYLLSIDNKKRPRIFRNKKSLKWEFGPLTILPWHPQFRKAVRMSELLVKCESIFEDKVFEVSLLKHLKFTPRDLRNKNVSEFTLFCDPNFEVNAYSKRTEESIVHSPRLSVIEFYSLILQSVCIGQIIAIVEFKGNTLCIVSRLIEESDQKTYRKLPYPLFKYAMELSDNTRFANEHVLIENVMNPCFSIPAIDHPNISIDHTGEHHAKQENISYFYVLTPDRSGLVLELEYEDYTRFNDIKHPWDKKLGSESCLNFNYYLTEDEMFLVRDVINL